MKTDKKWLVWGLAGFTGILLVTAVVLFFQLRKPAEPLPTPRPKPAASPVVPTVKEVAGEGVCELSFNVGELACTDVTVSPAGSSVEESEVKKLTAVVSGGSGTYNHSWSITTDGTSKGSLSAATSNPTNWTAPSALDDPQSWTVTDEITDTSTVPQTVECAAEFDFGGLLGCFDSCEGDSDCEGDLRCMEVGGDHRCVNPECEEKSNCICDDEELVCFDKCVNDSECPGDLRCMTYPGTNDKRCLNAECASEADCSCGISYASPSPKLIVQVSPEPTTKGGQPALPEAGVATPVVLGISAGLLMMIIGLLVL